VGSGIYLLETSLVPMSFLGRLIYACWDLNQVLHYLPEKERGREAL